MRLFVVAKRLIGPIVLIGQAQKIACKSGKVAMERIFVATVGMAPAVVTETLWALRAREAVWIPDRIEIVTTLGGAQAIRRDLLATGGPLATIYPAPWRIPPITVFIPLRDTASETVRAMTLVWADGQAVVVKGEHPLAISDVDDEEAAICMGDLILDRVGSACRDPSNQLHLSISGGRKTMSAHALFSLGLVGNPQDEASHVLMGVEFDSNRQFWHPDQGGRIHTVEAQRLSQGKPQPDWPAPTLDPRNAATTLRLFPIAAPRYDLIPRQRKGSRSLPRLSTILDQMNLAGDWLRAPRMELDVLCNAVTVNSCRQILDPMGFLWLRLLATAAQEGWTSPRDHGQPPGSVTVARLLFGPPIHTRLHELRRWFEEAQTAGLRGDDVARKAALRTWALTEASGDADPGDNLGTKIFAWIGVMDEAKLRGPSSFEAKLIDVAKDILAKMGSFTKLRQHLTTLFGAPLAEAMLPRRNDRPSPIDDLPQAAYTLNGAGPGFLQTVGQV